MSKFGVRSLSVAVCVGVASASAFLGSKEKQEIASDDVQEALQSLLASRNSVELRSIEDELRPMFVALPKNTNGALDHATVRYALHRYFVQKHGWYMNGLDVAEGWKTAAAPTLVKDRAPSFIQSVLEQRLHGEGLGLHDMAVFAATMSSLAHQENAANLYDIFDGLKMPLEEIPRESVDIAVKNFVLREVIGIAEPGEVGLDVDLTHLPMEEFYPSWDDLAVWLEDLRQERDLFSVHNPFVQRRQHSFESTVAFVEDMNHNFGKYQSLECMSLKTRLVDMDRQGTGRVFLRDFYAGFQHDPLHHFAESVDYLRNLGALDDRDPKRLSVVIPNYLMSKTNCLAASGFYSICCLNECEGLMRHVETEIAAPSGSPARIADLISHLPSDTVDSPRNLSSTLRGRLDEIASYHGGEVPLHGRLFSQWMHHAYPRECPFPHVSGTTSPLSPAEWLTQGRSDAASMEEVEKHLGVALEQDSDAQELPWTAVEELVVDYVKPSGSSLSSAVRGVAFLSAVAAFVAPLVKAVRGMAQDSDKAEKYMV